jgi:hypothetical protein
MEIIITGDQIVQCVGIIVGGVAFIMWLVLTRG